MTRPLRPLNAYNPLGVNMIRGKWGLTGSMRGLIWGLGLIGLFKVWERKYWGLEGHQRRQYFVDDQYWGLKNLFWGLKSVYPGPTSVHYLQISPLHTLMRLSMLDIQGLQSGLGKSVKLLLSAASSHWSGIFFSFIVLCLTFFVSKFH